MTAARAPAPAEKEAPINLLKGQPNPSLLPHALLRTAASHALATATIWAPALAYGPDAGYEPLRASIADWLTGFYRPRASKGENVTPERICITGGASQNLGNVLNVYTDPSYTRRIWLVAPAYFLAFRIFEDAGFAGKMRAVPEDGEGLDIAFLRREIRACEEGVGKDGEDRPRFKPVRDRAKVYKHVIYCVPTFANPSSRTMSLRRRRELVGLARECGGLVVCDDVYDFLQWRADAGVGGAGGGMETAHLPRVVDVDRELDGGTEREGADGFGNVCSNGSFSKIAGPGIRVGWVEGTEKFAYGVSQTGTTCSGGAPSQLTSTYVHQLVESGSLQDFIKETLRPAHARRYKRLMDAITTHLLPLGFTLPQADRDIIGGYFAWLGLPETLKAETLASRSRQEANVIIAPGKLFEVPGDEGVRFERSIRFCWAWEDEWKLEEGVRRVGEVARRMLEEGDNGGFVLVEKGVDGAAEFK